MVYIQMEKEVEILVTDEGEFFTLGGVLYHDYLAVSYEHDAEEEYYAIKNEEIDGLAVNNSRVVFRKMLVIEEVD